jgi:hypothetical protein
MATFATVSHDERSVYAFRLIVPGHWNLLLSCASVHLKKNISCAPVYINKEVIVSFVCVSSVQVNTQTKSDLQYLPGTWHSLYYTLANRIQIKSDFQYLLGDLAQLVLHIGQPHTNKIRLAVLTGDLAQLVLHIGQPYTNKIRLSVLTRGFGTACVTHWPSAHK